MSLIFKEQERIHKQGGWTQQQFEPSKKLLRWVKTEIEQQIGKYVVLETWQQVVAGVNYKLLILTQSNQKYDVIVWERLDGSYLLIDLKNNEE